MKQYKNFGTQIKDLDEKGRVLVAANAIGNVDSDSDITKDGAFDKTLSEGFKRVKWFLNHDKNTLLGVPIEGKQNGKYLEILGQLNMKKQVSRDIYEDYKLYAEHGRTLEHSVGVNAIKWEMQGDVRLVSEWKLWEYSTLTSWGANSDTPMLAMKENKYENITDTVQWLETILRKGNYTDERFVQIEDKLSALKTLLEEPVITTPAQEPSRDWTILNTIY